MAYFYPACAVRVTIFSSVVNSAQFWILCSYLLLLKLPMLLVQKYRCINVPQQTLYPKETPEQHSHKTPARWWCWKNPASNNHHTPWPGSTRGNSKSWLLWSWQQQCCCYIRFLLTNIVHRRLENWMNVNCMCDVIVVPYDPKFSAIIFFCLDCGPHLGRQSEWE